MKNFTTTAFIVFLASIPQARAAAVSFRYSEACILKAVAARLTVAVRPEIPLPAVFVQSETPLSQFQDAIEPQWQMRPDAFTNAYAFARNEIYLIDDEVYYVHSDRSIDDSLAHELTHYVQARYRGMTPADFDDAAEAEAVDTQSWFRDTYVFPATPPDPCQATVIQ